MGWYLLIWLHFLRQFPTNKKKDRFKSKHSSVGALLPRIHWNNIFDSFFFYLSAHTIDKNTNYIESKQVKRLRMNLAYPTDSS